VREEVVSANVKMLTIQDMIDQVISESDPMAKVAAATKAVESQKTKEDIERRADREEAQQGGGKSEGDPEKIAALNTEGVAKLASAVEEIVASLTGEPVPSRIGKVGAAEEAAKTVGPGKGPGASSTNVDAPTQGEQSDVSGEAKTKIPASPPTESKGSGGNPNAPDNAMATNADMMHPPQPAAGVLKQSSLREFIDGIAKEARTVDDDRVQQAATVGGAIGAGATRGLHAGAAGAHAFGPKGLLLAPVGAAAGAVGGGLSGLIRESDWGKKHPVAGRYVLPYLAGGVTGTGGAAIGAAREKAKIRAEKSKTAEDALNPAKIAAPKTSQLPEEVPSKMKRPAEVTSQEKLISSNEAVPAAKKVQTQSVPKKRMAEVLDEPAQTASTDKVLDQALGADKVDQAGAKIAAARNLLAKVASEGCSCTQDDLEKGSCQFCKVASVIQKQKGSVKTSQMTTSPAGAGSAVPSTVQQSAPSGTMAGGAPTPQM
jgi:hypothetical protein